MFMLDRRGAVPALLVALAVGVSACGGDGEETTAAEATPEAAETQAPAETGTGSKAPAGAIEVLAVEKESSLAFDPADLTATAGEVVITMDNPSGNQFPHTVAIEGNGVDESGEVVDPGNTSTTTAQLEAGEYTFYCPVGQHRQNGMEGTLTVE